MAVVFSDGFEHVIVRIINVAAADVTVTVILGHRNHPSQFWLNDAIMDTNAAFLLIQPCIGGSLTNRL